MGETGKLQSIDFEVKTEGARNPSGELDNAFRAKEIDPCRLTVTQIGTRSGKTLLVSASVSDNPELLAISKYVISIQDLQYLRETMIGLFGKDNVYSGELTPSFALGV